MRNWGQDAELVGSLQPGTGVIDRRLTSAWALQEMATARKSWAEANEQWLAGILDMPHGAPTQDVYLAVFFGALDPEAFSAVFRAWAQMLALPS